MPAEMEAPAEEVAADVDRTATTGAPGSVDLAQDFGRDIITEVGLTMATTDVARTADDVRRLTRQNGGAVFTSDVLVEPALDDGTVPGGGFIVVRIPPQDLDRLVAALDGVADVTRLTQDSEDVTDQLVDLEIRIRQAESGIERIEQILAQTVDLDDLFAVENELTRRQVELERLLASQRSTEDRVALATLTIQIDYTPIPADELVAADDDSGIADAFRSGWDAFVGALFAISFVLALAAPFLLTALVVVGLAALVTTRLRKRGDRTTPTSDVVIDDEVDITV